MCRAARTNGACTDTSSSCTCLEAQVSLNRASTEVLGSCLAIRKAAPSCGAMFFRPRKDIANAARQCSPRMRLGTGKRQVQYSSFVEPVFLMWHPANRRVWGSATYFCAGASGCLEMSRYLVVCQRWGREAARVLLVAWELLVALWAILGADVAPSKPLMLVGAISLVSV